MSALIQRMQNIPVASGQLWWKLNANLPAENKSCWEISCKGHHSYHDCLCLSHATLLICYTIITLLKHYLKVCVCLLTKTRNTHIISFWFCKCFIAWKKAPNSTSYLKKSRSNLDDILHCIIYLSMCRARSAQTATLNVSKYQSMYRYNEITSKYLSETHIFLTPPAESDWCLLSCSALQHKMSQLEIFTSSLALRLGVLWRSWGFAPSQHQPMSSLNSLSWALSDSESCRGTTDFFFDGNEKFTRVILQIL